MHDGLPKSFPVRLGSTGVGANEGLSIFGVWTRQQAYPPSRAVDFMRANPTGNFAGHSKNRNSKMNFNDQKRECVASMIRALESTSVWRKGIVAKFPNDPRLLKAAATLDQLAIDATNLTDDQWLPLKPFFGGRNSDAWRAALNLTVRQIGFDYRVNHLDAFVRTLVHQFSLSSSTAA